MTGAAPAPSRLWVWWRAVRPFSFTASVTPVLVGSAAAHYEGHFSALRFVVTLIAAVAIHAGTNLVNDYYDHARGVDTPESVGPGGMIQRGQLAPRSVLRGGLLLFAVGSLLGIWLVYVAGWPLLIVGIASVLAGYAYTGGPFPLGYIGLGDVVVFLFMGPVMVIGAYYVHAGALSPTAFWASLPVGALVTAILVVNNLRDLDQDRARGKRTLATALGHANTRWEYALLVGSAYVLIIAGVVLRVLPPAALVTLVSLRHASRTWAVVRLTVDPLVLTRDGLRQTALLHLRVGGVLAAALMIS